MGFERPRAGDPRQEAAPLHRKQKRLSKGAETDRLCGCSTARWGKTLGWRHRLVPYYCTPPYCVRDHPGIWRLRAPEKKKKRDARRRHPHHAATPAALGGVKRAFARAWPRAWVACAVYHSPVRSATNDSSFPWPRRRHHRRAKAARPRRRATLRETGERGWSERVPYSTTVG